MQGARAAAHRAVAEALPWRDRLDGVITVVLDYAARKPITFRAANAPGFSSDGVMVSATRPLPDDDWGRRSFLAHSEFPLAICVPSWSVCFWSDTTDIPHYLGVGSVDSESDWVDLACPGRMHTFELELGAVYSSDYRLCTRVSAESLSNSSRPSAMGIAMPVDEAKEAIATRALSTVRLSVDLETESITWTLFGGRSVSWPVPNLRHKFAYVNLPLGGSARIIPHADPWLF